MILRLQHFENTFDTFFLVALKSWEAFLAPITNETEMHLNCSNLLKNYLVRREAIFIGTLLLFVLPLANAQQKEQQEEYSFVDKR